jgi:hypothetical protein
MRRIWTADHDPNIRFPIGRFPVTTSSFGVREATDRLAIFKRWRRRETRAALRRTEPEITAGKNQTPETISAVT